MKKPISNKTSIDKTIKLFNSSKFKKALYNLLIELLDLRKNIFHPLVFILGNPKIGKNVSIGLFSEVNANKCTISIGDNCDIASFVSINGADSHKKVLGLTNEIERGSIIIEDNVFIGSHCFIGQNVHIGHHSVLGAGSIVIGKNIPPFSLVVGNPPNIKEGYYNKIV
jgi:acetyltransferase-like isoleucine patch superfamily enzyme